MGQYIRHAYVPEAPTWRVTSLSRGSTGELFQAIETLGCPTNLRVTCVDEHLEALSAAGELAERLDISGQLSLVRLDVLVKGMIRSRLRLVPQDLIFFQTLVQDVPEDALLDLFDEVHALLAPGGSFLLGQLHLPEDASLFMEHVLGMPVTGWPVDTLTELAQRSAFGSRFEWLASEENNLCSFLKLSRAL